MTFTSFSACDFAIWHRWCKISSSSLLGIVSKWSSTNRFRKARDKT